MDGCSARTTLGVSPDASLADIKTAYRTLAKHAHPDRGGDAAAFDRITRAYELLAAESTRSAAARPVSVSVGPPRPNRSVFRRPMWTRVAAAAVSTAPTAPVPPQARATSAMTFAEHLRRAAAGSAAA